VERPAEGKPQEASRNNIVRVKIRKVLILFSSKYDCSINGNRQNLCHGLMQGFLKDTVGKPARRSKIRSGGCHVFENTIALADAGRHGTDREEVVRRK
jgi:hypothetical protein